MKIRSPAVVMLNRAQLILGLAVLVPTTLLTPVGVLLLAFGHGSIGIVTGILVLSFCGAASTGILLGWLYLRRGASLARSQNEFLSSVSHEIRTPLTSIKMFIEMLRDDRIRDAAEKKRALDTLHQEIARLDGLVSRLMELSRLQSRAPTRDRVAVADVVRDAQLAFDAARLGQPAELRTQLEPGLVLDGDRAALAQAVSNLLVNAWKYSPKERPIVVTATAHDRLVEIAVSDGGPGIAPDERKRIFETFERGQAARSTGAAGSGLGLAIVRAVVQAHRGRLELDAGPDGGSCFRILLPRPRTA